MTTSSSNAELGNVRFIPLSYDGRRDEAEDSHPSARELILTLEPSWADVKNSNLDFVRFTDGITNTLLKVVNRRPGMTKAEMNREAILLRAYGKGTAVLIDREREANNHELLMKYDLAPDLLARFENGMLYRFISGTVANHHDLQDPSTLSAVARRLAQWHATVPCLHDVPASNETNGVKPAANGHSVKESIANTAPGKLPPNLWTSMHKWILALPTATTSERERQALLLGEMRHLVTKLSSRPGLGRDGLVFAHCDLLCANIIMHKDDGAVESASNGTTDVGQPSKQSVTKSVSFIDYEYATPSPAAFDIANHFAEWAGYDCDYEKVPTQTQRCAFVTEYIKTYIELSGENLDAAEETQKLLEEIDLFRGVPGFFWGIWALIQAMISDIDFDYASYAELRLGEYWAHKAEEDGSRVAQGKEMPLRERTWARKE